MSRKIELRNYSISGPQTIEHPLDEIKVQSKTNEYKYLLAHALDGVIWGIVKGGILFISSDKAAFPDISPELRESTLLEARLFGDSGEWFLWLGESGWQSRQIVDGPTSNGDVIQGETYDEPYILWGTNVGEQENKGAFHLAEEADLGIRHTPPKALTGRHSLRLLVRHYVDYDDGGAAFVKLSRLVDLLNGGEK